MTKPTFHCDLTARRAIVTGAASGIGRATSLSLAACGATVVLADVDESALAELTTQLRDSGADVLVASAGANIRRPLLDLQNEEIECLLCVKLLGVL